MRYAAPRGTQDIWGAEALRWQAVEQTFRQVCACFGYQEIRTPMFEETELFARSAGEETELVTKQMYTFTDRGGRSITLRPEGTPSVVRAYIEHKLHGQGGVEKFCYHGPIFRYERPQKGRLRQHHQFGVEVLGAPGPEVDAEVIALASEFLARLGITDTQPALNSMGCPECRPRYREALRAALKPVLGELCEYCQARYEDNPLRILDDKNERCVELTTRLAPKITDYLCEACQAHFQGLQQALRELGIEYQLNHRIVRGMDYYTRTVFEMVHSQLGAQNAMVGGGRYDGLVEECGGPSTPALGFGAGEERILMVLGQAGWEPPKPERLVYLAMAGDDLRASALRLAMALRRAGLAADLDHLGRSLRAQMREAARVNARYALILGEEEQQAGTVMLRDMDSGEQEQVPQSEVVARLTKKEG